MDRYSLRTRKWLDLRFDPELVELVGHQYEPYQPVHGIGAGAWTPGFFMMAARWAWLVEILRASNATSFLDVGGAEGYVAQMVRKLHVEESCSTDLSISACERAHEFFAIGTLASEAHRLPFEDDAFSVVYCAEVIEHLAHPVETLLELKRVARDVLIVASEEGVRDEAERARELEERALSDHMDRSIICATDFELLFPEWDTRVFGLCGQLPAEMPQSSEELSGALASALRLDDFREAGEATGMIAVLSRGRSPESLGSSFEGSARDVINFAFEHSAVEEAQSRVPGEVFLPARLCVKCGAKIELLKSNTCAACGVEYSEQLTVEDFVLQSEAEAEDGLAKRLQEEFPDAPERVEACANLQKLLDYPLMPGLSTRSLPLTIEAGWTVGETCQLSELSEQGLLLESEEHDPCMFSPELYFELASLRGVRVRLAVRGLSENDEAVQIFYRTLNRPLWWERASMVVPYQTTDSVMELEVGLPDLALFGEDDILTGLRVDPSHHASRSEILSVELI